jgi:nitrite reductase/ring-hydroxylating ferredoxin subunit
LKKVVAISWKELNPAEPAYALIANVDLVVIRWPDKDEVSVLYGRCLHRGALMTDGHVDGDNLICGLHNWDYSFKTGVSSYNADERLHRFSAWLEDGQVWVDEDEITAWADDNPQPYERDSYQGLYKDIHGAAPLC